MSCFERKKKVQLFLQAAETKLVLPGTVFSKLRIFFVNELEQTTTENSVQRLI